jgi:hypothetical protein
MQTLNGPKISSKSILLFHTHDARGRVPDASQPRKEPMSMNCTTARRVNSAKPIG